MGTLAQAIPRLGKIARRHRVLGVVLIDLVGFSSVQEKHGTSTGDAILEALKHLLCTTHLRLGNSPGIIPCTIGGDDFLLFFPRPGAKYTLGPELGRLRQEVETGLNSAVAGLSLDRDLSIHLGYAEIRPGPDNRIERSIYEAVKEAVLMAKSDMGLEDFLSRQEIQHILARREIHSVYQPIVSLAEGRVVGYEALSRGPTGSRWEQPLSLFSQAQKYGLLAQLELLCHRQAIRGLGGRLKDERLFLNVDPAVLGDPGFDPLDVEMMLREDGLTPGQVVLELTERSTLTDFIHLGRAVDQARGFGFAVAIDDVGSGYSGLRTLVDLKPDYVKIDASLIRCCDTDPGRRIMVSTLAHLVRQLGSVSVAEGVESPGEVEVLLAAGVNLAQGYLFAPPDRELPAADPRALALLRAGKVGTT